MEQISPQVLALISDPFGNYAITDIISGWPFEVCAQIYESLYNQLSALCIQKYSSNVVERCLELAPNYIKSLYIKELAETQ